MATNVLPLIAEVGTELCRVKLEGSLGGFRCDILTDNLSQREEAIYICPRCEGMIKDGSILNTGEQLCVCCLKEGEQSVCNAPIRNAILSLKCTCPLSKRGCDWLGTLESVENHLTTCDHVHVVASQREEACLHCSGVHKVCEMEEHVKVCGKVAVMCELGCGTRVCRENILCHRANECPEGTVVCPYVKYKCEVVGLNRRELKLHLEENRMLHMELKLNTLEETKLELSTLKKETELKFNTLEHKNVSLLKQITVLESNFELKGKEIEMLKAFIFKDGPVKWSIHDFLEHFRPNNRLIASKNRSHTFETAGYRFILCHTTDSVDFCINLLLLKGEFDDSLIWPLKAIFITRIVCHRDTKRSLMIHSPIIEFQKEEYKLICSIPLSKDLRDFIRGDCLDLEVTLRIQSNK